MSMHQKNDQWTSNLGVMLAVAGSAIGFGNFLRFPGLAAQYGGGAFVVAYFCCFLLLGLPLCWVEWSIGRRGGVLGGHSPASVFQLISGGKPLWKYLGIMGILAGLSINVYYVYMEGWTIGYAWNTAMGNLNLDTPKAYSDYFSNFVGMGADGHFFSGQTSVPIFFLLAMGANFWLIYRGVSKGIEWFCKWSMPLLFLVAIILLVRVLTMGTPDAAHPERSVNEGLGYMWNPDKTMLVDTASGKSIGMVPAGATDEEKASLLTRLQTEYPETTIGEKKITFWQSLFNPEMWLRAAGQVFFSLSVGSGSICCYASYVRRRKDIALSALSAGAANSVTEIGLAGLTIVPAALALLGVAAAATVGTFGLGFNVLPQVFAAMPGGQFFGVLFFILLFIGAVTSALSQVQPAVSFVEEYWNLRRGQSIALVAGLLAVGAFIIIWYTRDMLALDSIDFWVGSLILYVTTGLNLIFFNHVWGTKNGMEELKDGSAITLPRATTFIIRWITPAIMVVIFGAWLYQELFITRSPYVANIVEGRIGAILPLLWAVGITIFFCIVAGTSRRFNK
ncbi:MAG: sodium-dependent transporter [Akkermansia sp.]|nr:sodium-dependent transporter [Akkermansia sp.]